MKRSPHCAAVQRVARLSGPRATCLGIPALAWKCSRAPSSLSPVTPCASQTRSRQRGGHRPPCPQGASPSACVWRPQGGVLWRPGVLCRQTLRQPARAARPEGRRSWGIEPARPAGDLPLGRHLRTVPRGWGRRGAAETTEGRAASGAHARSSVASGDRAVGPMALRDETTSLPVTLAGSGAGLHPSSPRRWVHLPRVSLRKLPAEMAGKGARR